MIALRWAGLALLAGLVLLSPVAQADNAADTARRFGQIKGEYARLRAFLAAMPKGGDLHNHLGGAIYAERLIAWGIEDGICVQRDSLATQAPPCSEAAPPLARFAAVQANYDRLINAWSMRNYVRRVAVPNGHDQFFNTFGLINAAAHDGRLAAMIVDLARRNAAQNVQYLELMVSLHDRAAMAALTPALQGHDVADFADAAARLKAAGLDAQILRLKAAWQARLVTARQTMGCDGPTPEAGCQVTIRLLGQVLRANDPATVFTQTAIAAALVRAEPLAVGLNYVQPEDYLISRRDYGLQMRLIRFLAGDDVPVALHAGELWIGMVPPEDLAFHIRDAVEVAGARRIGHGVDLAFEYDQDGLLATMRARNVAVEICLTSNDVILGVRGKLHPFRTYRNAGVPVVIATDDEGVSRIDLTNEYLRAVTEQGLDYPGLKQIARAALVHSFLPAADKQAELARFDRAVTAFEKAQALNLKRGAP